MCFFFHDKSGRSRDRGEKTWKGLSWGKFPYLREFCLSCLKGIQIKNEVWLPSGATPHPRLRTFWFAHFEFTDLNYGPQSMNHPVYFCREYQFVFWTGRQSKPPFCCSRTKWGRKPLMGRVSLRLRHSLTHDHHLGPLLSDWVLLIRGNGSAIVSPWTCHLPPRNLSHLILDKVQRVRIHRPARTGSHMAGGLSRCPFPLHLPHWTVASPGYRYGNHSVSNTSSTWNFNLSDTSGALGQSQEKLFAGSMPVKLLDQPGPRPSVQCLASLVQFTRLPPQISAMPTSNRQGMSSFLSRIQQRAGTFPPSHFMYLQNTTTL